MKVNGNLTFLTLGSGQLENAIIERLPSAPTGAAGRIYYDTSVNFYYYYNGTSWQQFSAASSAVSSFQTSLNGLTPNTSTTGAITLAGTLGVPSGGTGDTTLTSNGVLYGQGVSPLAVTAAGVQYNVLTVNGSDVPGFGQVSLNQSNAVTGTLGANNGGTGSSATPSNGQLLIGNGTSYTTATLASGTGISTTTGSGTLQINNTGVTSIVAGSGITVSASTGAVTISSINASISTAVAAAGSTQGTATALFSAYNIVTSGTGGVALFTSVPGQT